MLNTPSTKHQIRYIHKDWIEAKRKFKCKMKERKEKTPHTREKLRGKTQAQREQKT